MLVDKQSELMSDLLFTVHQHGGDDVTWKLPIDKRVLQVSGGTFIKEGEKNWNKNEQWRVCEQACADRNDDDELAVIWIKAMPIQFNNKEKQLTQYCF